MGFAGVYRAIYAYAATNEQELSLQEGDILYLLETADDGWWTVKKRVVGAASEEPEGIVPHNYIEPAPVEGAAVALYSYEQQNDEELSFVEGARFQVYATEGDWVLVGMGSQYGFVPANYIQMQQQPVQQQPVQQQPPVQPVQQQPVQQLQQPVQQLQQPVQQQPQPPVQQPVHPVQPVQPQQPAQQYKRDMDLPPTPSRSPSPETPPPKPQRPGRSASVRSTSERSAHVERERSGSDHAEREHAERRELTFPVMDVVGRRKIPKTLVVAQQYVTLINDDGGGRTQKWEVPDIVRYSSEKKYVFLDLLNPKASLQLRVNSTLEASQIVASLGQIVGAGRAGGGLQEVLNAAEAAGMKQGQILLDFEAANGKELSVHEGDIVNIVSTANKDWWLVRTVQGREGLVPRKFVHIEREENKLSGLFKGKKQRERQLERDQSSARETARSLNRQRSMRAQPSSNSDVRRENSKPSRHSMRVWVDRTGTFKVDAKLLGCNDGKVHLHKANGVAISVPASKLSLTDIEYVERATGVDLSDDKPLSRSRSSAHSTQSRSSSRLERRPSENRSSEHRTPPPQQPQNDNYDFWLSFFLDCGVDPQNANRYAKNFTRDNLDEDSLADINTSLLRTLGLREGDILRTTKRINERLGRVQKPEGGLYSSEGALTNNSGTTPKSVESEVWQQPQQQQQPQQPIQPQPTAPQQPQQPIQPQPTAPQQPQPIQPQPTAPVQQPQPIQPQPTAQPKPSLSMPALQPQPAPLQPQQTKQFAEMQAAAKVEAEIAAVQRETQRKIIEWETQLQQEQIGLLKKKQEALRKQEEEFLQSQKTGLQPLGPFATGNAQLFTPAQPPQPPMPRPMPAAQPTTSFQTTGLQTTGLQQHTTGPFNTGLQTTGLQQHTTGPFNALQPNTVQQHTTGPFNALNTLQTGLQQHTTGPFNAGLQTTGLQQHTTGPFNALQPNTVQQHTTGPFNALQQHTTGPFNALQPNPVQQHTTGPFNALNTLQNPVQQHTTGPFNALNTLQNPVQQHTTGPFNALNNVQQHTTGPFNALNTLQQNPMQPTTFNALQQHTTGPFNAGLQQHTTGPFNAGLQQHTTGPFNAGLQQHTTGPFNALNTATQFNGANAGAFPTAPTTFQTAPTTFQTAPATFPQQPGMQPHVTGPFQVQQPHVTGPFQQVQQSFQPLQPTPAQPAQPPNTSFGAQPLQNQATGFGFGNQASQPRANLSMASASNPFGL